MTLVLEGPGSIPDLAAALAELPDIVGVTVGSVLGRGRARWLWRLRVELVDVMMMMMV